MRNIPFLLSCILIIAYAHCGYSRPAGSIKGYSITHYSTADGLVANQCNAILRDSRGFLWVATFCGLSRFDGRQFTSFTTRDGLRENGIQAIFESKRGQVWVATSTAISCYTGGYPYAFRTYPLPKGAAFAADVCTDTAGTVYALSAEGKIYGMASGDTSLRLLNAVAGSILRLRRDKSGTVYTIDKAGVMQVLYGGRVRSVYTFRAPGTSSAAPMLIWYFTPDGALWGLDRNTHTAALAGPDGFSQYGPAPPAYDHSFANRFSSAAHAIDGGAVLHRRGQRWDTVLSVGPLGTVVIDVVEEATTGLLWLISYNGLYCLCPSGVATIPLYAPTLYYSTAPSGQVVLHNDSTIYARKDALQWYKKLAPTLLYAYRARDGAAWYGTSDGLYRLALGAASPTRYVRPTRAGIDSNYKRYNAIMEDHDGRVWASCYYGITAYSGGKYRHFSEPDGLAEGAIYSMAVDRSGTLFAGSLSVFALLPGRDSFFNVSADLGLSMETLAKLATGPDGHVWIAQHNSRLLKIGHCADGRFYIADSLDLEQNGIEVLASSIDFDARGNLWVASGHMIIYSPDSGGHYSPSRKTVLPETVGDSGFPILYPGADGAMYLCHSGDHRYEAQRWHAGAFNAVPDLEVHQIYITRLSLFRRPQPWAALGYATDDLGIPIAPALSYRQNFLSFSFTAPASGVTDIVMYRYRLIGLDTGWTTTANVAPADYNNLAPGTYTFEVEASNSMRVWSRPLQYHFKILPPWYRTWWASALWCALGLGIIALIIKLRVSALSRRAKTERLLVEQQLKALRAQINPHFLQNTFSFLSQTLEDQPMQYSQRIIRQLSAYLRNALDRSDEQVSRLEDEVLFAEEYLAINRLLFRESFSYEITVSPEVDTFGIRVPTMILQPLLENAIKHGVRHKESGGPHSNMGNKRPADISLQIWSAEGITHCRVCNPSSPAAGRRGMGLENRPKGLSITEERISLLYRHAKRPAGISVEIKDSRFCVLITIPAI